MCHQIHEWRTCHPWKICWIKTIILKSLLVNQRMPKRILDEYILPQFKAVPRASWEDSPKPLGNYLTFSLGRSQWTRPKCIKRYTPPQKEWLETSNNMEGFGSWCFWTKFSGWCSSSGAFFFQWEHFSSDLWAKWPPHIHHRQSSHPRMLPAGHHTFSVDLFRFENGGFPSRWKLVHSQNFA